MNAVVIIPTLDPDARIIALVDELRERGFSRFIVVNDGSAADRDPLFDVLAHSGVHVLRHTQNRGKGAAIKTALDATRTLFPDATHIVTVDGDGQHLPADIANVCEVAQEHRGHVVLGIRDFKGAGVPFKSRIGNAFSAAYFKLDTGMACPDTQTGLRVIPVQLIPFALSIEGERYEYEMNFLTALAKKDLPLIFTPIETVYENNNAGSHFSPLRDSARIYRQLLRFACSSLSCSLVDLGLFALITMLLNLQTAALVTVATIVARMASGALNFTLNRTWSFRDAGSSLGDARNQAVRYALLFFAQMMASGLLVTALSTLPLPLVVVKMLVDSGLFVASYFIQRNWVFKQAPKTQALIVKGVNYAQRQSRKPTQAA